MANKILQIERFVTLIKWLIKGWTSKYFSRSPYMEEKGL